MLLKISSMFETIIPQEGKAVAMFVVLASAVAGLIAVTFISDSACGSANLGNLSDSSVVAELSGLSKHPHLTAGNVSDSSVVAQNPEMTQMIVSGQTIT